MSQINVDIIRSRTGTAATCDKGLVVSGVTTSTTFSGAVTGNVTGSATGLSGSPDITIGNLTGVAGTYSGVVKVTDTTEATSTTTGSVIVSGGVGIAKSLFVGGNISVGGTLTYEDVQNVDSIGIITARDDINIVTDSKKLNIGAGSDLQLYHDSSDSWIVGNTGSTIIAADSLLIKDKDNTASLARFTHDGDVKLYSSGTQKFQTTAHGAITSGIHTVTVGTDLDGYKVEEGNSDTSTALNGEFDFELENGHVQRYSTATGGNYFPDFRVSSSQSLNSVMDIGDVVSVTLMVASSSHYCTTGIKIDNSTSNLDIDWIGGAAPSAANGSGYDIYAFTIQKTGSAPAYHIIGNALGAA
jgi:hypothetical protein